MSADTLELWDVCARKYGGNAESQAARKSCKASEQREKVFAAVVSAGAEGITCHELAARWGVSPNQISGRFSELKSKGRVWKDGTRRNAAGQVCGVIKAREAAA